MAMKVNKERKMVWIYTEKFKVEGYIYVVAHARLSDALMAIAKQSPFIPITDAEIMYADGIRKKVRFLMIQISAIEIIFEVENVENEENPLDND